jgi:hypothetical protein
MLTCNQQSFRFRSTYRANIAGGIGLGLYLCKALVSRMGGQMGCNSTFGHGSTFWFWIPVEHRSRVRETDIRRLSSSENANKSLRILVVDDMEINRRILQRFHLLTFINTDMNTNYEVVMFFFFFVFFYKKFQLFIICYFSFLWNHSGS